MSFEQQQQQQRGVEELANRLNQMNVYSQQVNLAEGQQQQQQQTYCADPSRRNPLTGSDLTNIRSIDRLTDNDEDDDDDDMDVSDCGSCTSQENNFQRLEQQQEQHQQQSSNNLNKSGNILIVTNVDSSVFSDQLTQSQFESLFLAYDNQVTFRYLRSFRRVRLDFTDSQRAELARQKLASFKIGDSLCKCYIAQIIKPQSQQEQQDDNTRQTNYGNNLNKSYLSTNHLNIPKLTKQFLISPPASPPVGWEPVKEGSPCIDVQLLSAMANLVPGKVHEIHQGNESQPGIFVEVCENPQYPAAQTVGGGGATARRHIPKTPLPLKPSF